MKKIIALALTVLAAGAATAAPAGAATVPTVPTGGTASTGTATIPKGFLLYEKEAAKKDDDPETTWKVSGSVKTPLAVNPCDRSTPARTGRLAARTVTYTAVPDFMKVEQVVLYRSPADAARAVSQVRAALVACRSDTRSGSTYRYAHARQAGIGDEALRVSGQVYYRGKAGVGGDRSVLVRKGSAVLIYQWAGEYSRPVASDWAVQLRDARRMTAKVCSVAICR
ncbi:hypothetical protein ACIBCT_27650 [Streptosporangium sp. NPDC050855]|uniref:hypothetical protein n=1 Tax=Streptosporangium sp. NPDC050855 TaxID=3366194 RepID=UPI0037952E29